MKQRRLGLDLYCLRNVTDLHGNVDANCTLDFNRDRLAHEATEPWFLDFDAVLTGHEIDELVISRFVGLPGTPVGSGQIYERDGGSSYGTARLVRYRANYRSIERLRSRRCCEQDDSDQRSTEKHDTPREPRKRLGVAYTGDVRSARWRESYQMLKSVSQ